MDANDLLKDLKKIDMDRIKKSDIKIFKNEKIAVDYYNDAVDNILEGNIDIAAIKLRKVRKLSPDFAEAAQLIERLDEYEKTKSIGDKVYESIYSRNSAGKSIMIGRRTLPQMLNINPRILLKIIIVLVVISITIGICVAAIKLFSKPTEENNQTKEVSYSQEEVNTLNKRIDELEESLAVSESETQDALSGSTADKASIADLEKERDSLKNLLNLYKAAVYFEQEDFVLSADTVKTLDKGMFSGAEKELYNEVYIKAVTKAADSIYTIGLNLFSQKDYQGTIENLEMVEEYFPDFEKLGNCYYIMGKAYYELDNAAKAIELYENIEMNIPEFENETGLLYYTAKAYQKLEEFDKARELYNTLINGYPESSLIGYAKDRIKEMIDK